MALTEKNNAKSEDIDTLSAKEILLLMHEEDATITAAIRAAIPDISKAVEEAIKVIKNGGRIFYVGAGTSGRLGVLDASEMPPTFSVPPDLFQAIIAGGDRAIRRSIEGAEDNMEAGRKAASNITNKDIVIGISASGGAPFVLACLAAAKDKGANCWLLTCDDIELPIKFRPHPSALNPFVINGIIRVITGPEIIAGSTRLKAGTATKLALNMFSTATMIRLGKVYKGLMVDVTPSNKKLVGRAENIIMKTTGCTGKEAAEYLKLSGMRPKVAIVMKTKGVSREKAEALLGKAEGFLRKVVHTGK